MALRHLTLRDFVIVPELELDLERGFSALTGETGAGKSILVDALQLVLGARGDATWVREDRQQCDIAAEFDAAGAAPVSAWLDENGFTAQEGGALLRRTIDANGKSRGWINGTPATMGQLRDLGLMLVDIHGQHAWQNLMRPDAVRALLDEYAQVDRPALQRAWQAWRDAARAVEAARNAQQRMASERDRLTWQIGELDKLAPATDEWEDLSQRHTRLANAQALIDAAQNACAALESDASDMPDARSAVAQAQGALEDQVSIEPSFAPLIEALQACDTQLADVVHSLKLYWRDTDLDPDQFTEIDARVSHWMALARRFHREPAELPALLAEWREELARLESAADTDGLQAAERAAQAAWHEHARTASALRAKAAPVLSRAVTQRIRQMGMESGVFQATLDKLEEPAAWGLEDTRLLFAAHAKATPRPVERVASGGELSRLALAVAVTTSAAGAADTLIFDEVDAGIGGAVASTVGQLLQRLGRERQVLCVTHLAQVAACATQQLSVRKIETGAGVSSVVEVLSDADRVDEIARMLGGDPESATTRAHAREVLASAATSALPPERGGARSPA